MLAAAIKKDAENLDAVLNGILERAQQVIAEITLSDLDKQASLVINLREIKNLLKDSLRQVNRILAPTEQHLCQTIANMVEDGVSYQCPEGTITATARGFFGIDEPLIFFNWLSKHVSKKFPVNEFVQYTSSKKARAELCENLLIQGASLPSGIKEHIVASVTIRRKSNG